MTNIYIDMTLGTIIDICAIDLFINLLVKRGQCSLAIAQFHGPPLCVNSFYLNWRATVALVATIISHLRLLNSVFS